MIDPVTVHGTGIPWQKRYRAAIAEGLRLHSHEVRESATDDWHAGTHIILGPNCFKQLAARDMREATEMIARDLETREPTPAPPEELAPATPDSDEARHDPDLLTQTMAELYASQGLFHEAETVYRELLKFRPDDPALLERLEATRARILRLHDGPLGRRATDERTPGKS